MKKIIISIIISLSVFAYDLQEQVNEIDQRLSDIELMNAIRKFSIHGNFINHWETYAAESDSNGISRGHSVYIFSSLLEIDLNFKLTSNLSFYSRLGMSKLWNTENNEGSYQRSETDDTWDTSNQGSFGYWGSTPKFDRAYLSYNFHKNRANFSIGRMSTHKGPPAHQQFNESRTGTYPRFIYNAIFDGMAASYDFSSYLPEKHNLELSFLYTPFVNISKESRTEKRTDKDSSGNVVTAKPVTDQFTFQAEYLNNSFDLFELNLIYFYYKYNDFYQNVPDEDIYIWNATAHAFYLGLNNIWKKNINFSVSYLNLNEDGLTSGENSKDHYKSYGWLYGLNFNFLNQVTLGAEYILTSPEFYVDDWTYYTISDFYRVPNNKGGHVYISFPVFDLTKLKVGYFQYSTKGGNTFDADSNAKEVRSVYATLQTTF